MLTDEQIIVAMNKYDQENDHVGGLLAFARTIEQAARNEALGDAAKRAEEFGGFLSHNTGKAYAAEIRALIDKQ